MVQNSTSLVFVVLRTAVVVIIIIIIIIIIVIATIAMANLVTKTT